MKRNSTAALTLILLFIAGAWLSPTVMALEAGQTPVAEVFLKASAQQPIAPPGVSSRSSSKKSKDPVPHTTGLLPPTPEQKRWERENMVEARGVRPNVLGLARLKTGKEGLRVASRNIGALPSAVDNSLLNCFPPIGNQGGFNACGPYSTTYYLMTHMVGLVRGWDAKNGGDSFRFSPKWTYNMLNNGANNSTWYTNLYGVLLKHGAAKCSQLPYDGDIRAWSMNAAVWREAISCRMDQSGLVVVTAGNGMNDLKQMLANGYVLNFATYVDSWQYKNLANDPGTSDDDALVGEAVCYFVNGTSGSHGMTVVGYNDTLWTDINGNGTVDAGEKGAFKIANSWGTGFKNNGFAWIAYDALKTTTAVSGWTPTGKREGWWDGIAYWVTARSSYTPSLLAEFTIRHPKRGRVAMQLGTADGAATTPSTNWYPWMINYQGGDYAFDGTTTECDGLFYYDFSDLAPAAGVAKRFFLGLRCTQDTGSIKAFRLIDVGNGDAATAATGLPRSVTAGEMFAWVDYTRPATNTPPTVSGIASQEIAVNTETGALAFTVGDAQTPAGSLVLTAASSNGALVAPSGMVFGGSGANRTLTVQPQAGAVGTTTVTVSVSDTQATTSTSFVLRVSHPPTLSALADQTIDEDASTGALAFTIGDADTPVASLSLSATSSDTSLVAVSNIVFSGSSANRTLTVTPAANRSGSTTITVTVSDGLFSANKAFVLTARPINDAPRIVSGPSATPAAPTLGQTVSFHVEASDPDGNSLSFTWLFGDGATSTAAAPAHAYAAAGTYRVTLTVSDGIANVSTGMDLGVQSLNTPPQIGTLDDLSIAVNADSGALPFTVGDAQTPADALALTAASSNQALIAPSGLVFGGSGANRTITVTPERGKTGTATITVNVSDGQATSSARFVATVTKRNASPVIRSALLASPNPAAAGADVAFSLAVDDPDGEALSFAWVFGDGSTSTEPLPNHRFASAGLFRVTVTVSDGQGGVVSDNAEVQVQGTDPDNADSGKARPLLVDKVRMKALFTTAGRDSVSMKAIIPDIPAGFNPDGARLELDVAGGIVLFTLDKSGAAVSSNGWVRMKLKSTINEETGTREFAGGAVPVMLKLNGSWAEAWSAQGFGPDTDAKNMAMTVTVTMLFNGGNYEASVKGAYSCKAGKSATFKQ